VAGVGRFVTYVDANDAQKAVRIKTPLIDNRRANCNLAALGPRLCLPSSLSLLPAPFSPLPRPSPLAAVSWRRAAQAPAPCMRRLHAHLACGAGPCRPPALARAAAPSHSDLTRVA